MTTTPQELANVCRIVRKRATDTWASGVKPRAGFLGAEDRGDGYYSPNEIGCCAWGAALVGMPIQWSLRNVTGAGPHFGECDFRAGLMDGFDMREPTNWEKSDEYVAAYDLGRELRAEQKVRISDDE